MSTILRALQKRRVERDTEQDPETILERNAAYRETLRPGNNLAGGPRSIQVLAGVSLLLVVVCAVGTTVVWLNRSSSPDDRPGASEDEIGALAPAATPGTLAPQTAQRAMQEKATLRTRPMIRPPAAVPEDAPLYSPGPQGPPPTGTPAPVVMPQPIYIVTGGQTGGREKTSAAAPPAVSEDPREFLRLTGVILDPKRPTALINDRIVQIGDVVEGAKVLAIDNSSSVRVEYHRKQYSLELK